MSLLPWLEPLAKRTRDAVAEARLPHALLVTGPEGWGEGAFASWLALFLLGLDQDRDVVGLAHPDLRWIASEGSVIKVDQVRTLVEFAQGTPQSGPRKVAVIAEAHYLNNNAANALLKTLEEPPAGTHLVLSSCHPGRLSATIRSRCQTMVIRPEPALARRWLEGHATGDDLERRMFEHGGAPLAVVAGIERGEQPLDGLIAGALASQNSAEVVKTLLAHDLADALGRWYRYVLALAAGERTLERLAATPRRGLLAFADELNWARRQLLTSNSANPRLLAERMVALWRQLARDPGHGA